ncbi:MAG: VanZ family protein [Culicoidibacterales bacterium]
MNFFHLLDNRPFVSAVIVQYILFILLYVLIRICYVILQRKWEKNKELGYFIGMLYFTFVIAITTTRLNLTLEGASILARIQLMPFDTVTRYWPLDGEYALYNIIGNFILMIPILPILRYCFMIKSVKKAFVFTLFFTLSIEVAQLFFTTSRAFDVDDIILNVSGFCISALFWWLFQKIKVVK